MELPLETINNVVVCACMCMWLCVHRCVEQESCKGDVRNAIHALQFECITHAPSLLGSRALATKKSSRKSGKKGNKDKDKDKDKNKGR